MWKCPRCETENEGDICKICGLPYNSINILKQKKEEVKKETIRDGCINETRSPFYENPVMKTDRMIVALKKKVKLTHIITILLAIIQLILFFLPNWKQGELKISIYQVLSNDQNAHVFLKFDNVERVCSGLLLAVCCIALVALLINYKPTQRNIPIILESVSMTLVMIYSIIILYDIFRNEYGISLTPYAFVLYTPALSLICLILICLKTKWMKQMDNYRLKPAEFEK